MYRVLLDTTYILPAFGIYVDIAPKNKIKIILEKCIEKGVTLNISEISLFEAYVKTIAVAKKKKLPDLFKKAANGILTVINDTTLNKIGYCELEILEIASNILKNHDDPFDAIIFATAIVRDMSLATEDSDAKKFVPNDKILSWRDLKNMF